MTRRLRLAVVVSHPIQYFVPLYRALAKSDGCDLRVFFASRIGLESYRDTVMGVDLAWKMDLLGGYASEFLPGAEAIREIGFRQVDNPGIGRRLAAFGPDAVIINGYALMTMLRALAWCRMHRVPAIMLSDSSINASAGGWRAALKRRIGPLLLKQFSAFLTMSDRSEAYFRRLGVPANRLFRTPTVIDGMFWRARAERTAIRGRRRAELGLQADEVALLYVGKLYPGKRVGDLVAALAALRARGLASKVRLLVAGDGVDRAELERLATRDGVPATFLGFQNIDQLPDLYCAADVLAHPAEVEQYGMVALEAAVLGLPLILSDRVGSIGETSIARPDVNALVYPCGGVEALAASIDRLARDSALRRAMSDASLEISQEHEGLSSVTGVYEAAAHVVPQRRGTSFCAE